jgi:hypothetical protein
MFASSRWRKISRQRAAELCGVALMFQIGIGSFFPDRSLVLLLTQ